MRPPYGGGSTDEPGGTIGAQAAGRLRSPPPSTILLLTMATGGQGPVRDPRTVDVRVLGPEPDLGVIRLPTGPYDWLLAIPEFARVVP